MGTYLYFFTLLRKPSELCLAILLSLYVSYNSLHIYFKTTKSWIPIHNAPPQMYIFNLRRRRKPSHYFLNWALSRLPDNLYFFVSIFTIKTVLPHSILFSQVYSPLLHLIGSFRAVQPCSHSF